MWFKFKQWWKGYTTLHLYLTGGQIIELLVTKWKLSDTPSGKITSYEVTFHPRNRNHAHSINVENICAIVEYKH